MWFWSVSTNTTINELWTPIFSMNVSLMSSKIHSIEWNWPNLFLEKNNQFSRQKYCTISVCNPQFVKYKFKLFWYILTIYKISTNWRHLYFFHFIHAWYEWIKNICIFVPKCGWFVLYFRTLGQDSNFCPLIEHQSKSDFLDEVEIWILAPKIKVLMKLIFWT